MKPIDNPSDAGHKVFRREVNAVSRNYGLLIMQPRTGPTERARENY
jgi:hypothetical protein